MELLITLNEENIMYKRFQIEFHFYFYSHLYKQTESIYLLNNI